MLQFKKTSAYVFFHTSELHNTFIDCSPGDETIHCDLARLSQAMSTVHCLCIVRRIPVVVVENDCVGGR